MDYPISVRCPTWPLHRTKTDPKKKNFKGKILMATVKGDVHDIGKNIVYNIIIIT